MMLEVEVHLRHKVEVVGLVLEVHEVQVEVRATPAAAIHLGLIGPHLEFVAASIS